MIFVPQRFHLYSLSMQVLIYYSKCIKRPFVNATKWFVLQQKKRELVASAFGEDEKNSRQSRLTVEDLTYLFMA